MDVKSKYYSSLLKQLVLYTSLVTVLYSTSIIASDSTNVDLFPLRYNFRYQYSYRNIYIEHGWGGLVCRDSGYVDLIVRDSSIIGDTLKLWTIEEINQLSHSIMLSRVPNSSFIQNDTLFFTLSESLNRNHLITVPSYTIFSSNYSSCYGPWSGISIDRYSSTSPLIQITHALPLFGYDSTICSQLSGLQYRFNRTEWVGTSFWVDTLTIQQVGFPTVGIKDKPISPLICSVQQNYPNPFNPTTTIKYTLAKSTHVKISVYDLLGRLIAKLVDKVEPRGENSIVFNSSTLSSGIYFYLFQADNYIQTRKMVLMR